MTRLVSCLVCCCLSVALLAERADVEVSVGFQGVVPAEADMIPISVTVRNQVAATRGLVKIIQPDFSGKSNVTDIFPFDSPLNSTKRFSFPIHYDGGATLGLEVDFARPGPEAVSRKLSVSKANGKLLLSCGEFPAALLASVAKNYRRVAMPPDGFFPAAIAYGAVDAILLSPAALETLGEEQVSALDNWVKAYGGTLVVSPAPESEAARHRWAGLAPSGRGTLQTTADGAGLALFAPGQAEAKAAENQYPFHFGGVFQNLSSKRSGFGLLSFVCLLAILGLYLLVIGPVDYLIAKKTRRSNLTWPIFLGAVGVFSLLGYFFSSLTHLEGAELHGINYVDVAPGGGPAEGRSCLSFQSNRNGVHKFRAGRPGVFLAALSDRGGEAATMADIIAAGWTEGSWVSAKVPVFSSRDFVAFWESDYKGARWDAKSQTLELPPGLKASSAYLVDNDSIQTLTLDGGKWRRGGKSPQTPRTKFLELQRETMSDSKSFTRLPTASLLGKQSISERRLEACALLVSLGGANPNAGFHGMMPEQFEVRLDLSQKLENGDKYVLAFLKDAKRTLPLEVDGGGDPRQTFASLLRLPAN